MKKEKKKSLTGEQVRFIRGKLKESQMAFAKRFDVSQPVIFRLEAKQTPETGPLVILILQAAEQNGIKIPRQIKKKETVEKAPVDA